MRQIKLQQGVSLIEVLIVVAIIGVVLTLTAPAVTSLQQRLTVKGAVENIYFLLQLGKSNAIRQSNTITVDTHADTSGWCMGITDNPNCDCATVNSCTVDGREQVVSSADFSQVMMQNITFDANGQAQFDGIRGMPPLGAAQLEVSDNTNTVRLSITPTGRVDICNVAGDIGGYDAC
ncbi:GspH/FimT family pseudopilin [Alteromonas gilva]|uniref:Type II secretion system protein H n=1 Tax=Alteromonas gilva TaxID=2987522 RepID=A0ABT5L876_9ALTE|nr:GspH/FimT family pseudopilin [Alteromonas gilva]MDC8832736.1 GspH/FimT family pseudopilin [Alteromonas gilva]